MMEEVQVPPGITIIRTIYNIRVIRDGWLDLALFWTNEQIPPAKQDIFAYEKSKKLGLPFFQLAVGQDIEDQAENGVYLCAIRHEYGKNKSLRVVRDHGRMTGGGFGRLAARNNDHIHDPWCDDYGAEQRAFDDNYRLKQMGF